MKFQKTVCDISFFEKLRIFSDEYLKCFVYISKFTSSQYLFTKNLFSKLIGASQVLEDFLDFHGAKNSKEWYFYRELSAAVRHLSLGGYSQTHILNRLGFYGLPDAEGFEKEGTNTLYFIRKSLMTLAPVILDEARRLNIPIPEEGYDLQDFPGIITGEMLNYDIDDADKQQQKKHIVNSGWKVLNKYLPSLNNNPPPLSNNSDNSNNNNNSNNNSSFIILSIITGNSHPFFDCQPLSTSQD